MSLHNNYLRCD